MEETTTNKTKRWLTTFKLIGGVLLVPILGLLYIIDRIILTPFIWRGVYPVQDIFGDLRLAVPMLYRLAAFLVVVLVWIAARMF